MNGVYETMLGIALGVGLRNAMDIVDLKRRVKNIEETIKRRLY